MLNDKTTEICERLDWSIYLGANEDVELRKESPAGEDFSICVDSKNFIQNERQGIRRCSPTTFWAASPKCAQANRTCQWVTMAQ